MSHLALPIPGMSTRPRPRWSVVGQPASLPASIAGLPASRRWVLVGPSLSSSRPSWGVRLTRSPTALKPQLLALSRLLPAEVTGPWQFTPVGAVLLATMVFFAVSGLLPVATPPPELPAELPTMVLLVSSATVE